MNIFLLLCTIRRIHPKYQALRIGLMVRDFHSLHEVISLNFSAVNIYIYITLLDILIVIAVTCIIIVDISNEILCLQLVIQILIIITQPDILIIIVVISTIIVYTTHTLTLVFIVIIINLTIINLDHRNLFHEHSLKVQVKHIYFCF